MPPPRLRGPPVTLDALVLDPPHSLLRQSYAARELLRGVVCADGFGVGWYAQGEPEPAVYRREAPIWADADLPRVGRAVRSGCVVAAVRNGTPGIPGGPAAVAPMPLGGYLFAQNGHLAGFAERARALREGLPDDLYAAMRGASDSETLFMIVLARIREAAGDLAAGVAAALAEVGERSPGSGLNVIVADGAGVVASRLAAGVPADTLYLLEDEGLATSGGCRWPPSRSTTTPAGVRSPRAISWWPGPRGHRRSWRWAPRDARRDRRVPRERAPGEEGRR